MAAARKEVPDSIQFALRVLDSAAEESAAEIQKMVSADYKHLREVLANIEPQVTRTLTEVKESATRTLNEARERLHDGARTINKSVYSNPWNYIGSAAVVCGVTGFLLGRQKKD